MVRFVMSVSRLFSPERIMISTAALSLLAACAAVPDLGPAPAIRTAQSVAAQDSLHAPDAATYQSSPNDLNQQTFGWHQ